MHGTDEVRNLGIAPELVRCPAARHHDAVQPRGVNTVRCRISPRLEGVLAADRFGIRSDGDDLGTLLLQTHHRDPVLEVLETLGHENRDLLPFQPHKRLLSYIHHSPVIKPKSSSTSRRATSPPSSRARASAGTASAPRPDRSSLSAVSRCSLKPFSPAGTASGASSPR